MRLEDRFSNAEAALSSFEHAVPNALGSSVERDSAILRLMYTFIVISNTCRRLLEERERIKTGSPKGAIHAALRLGWLSHQDAKALLVAGRDRQLAFEAYRPNIADEIASRLPNHAAVLRHWINALQARAIDNTA